MGLPDGFDDTRLARHYSGKYTFNPKDSNTKVMMDKNSLPWKSHNSIYKFNVWKAKQHEIPSALGFGSASGIASILSILANDGKVEGQTFLQNPNTVRAALSPIAKCKDLVSLRDNYWTQGGLATRPSTPNVVWHAGWGGSLGLVDNNYKMSFAYVTNTNMLDLEEDDKYHQGPRQAALLDVVYKCIKRNNAKL